MYPTTLLQWFHNGQWHTIGWPGDTPERTADLREHGKMLALHGGRYRLVQPGPDVKEWKVVHEWEGLPAVPARPSFVLDIDGEYGTIDGSIHLMVDGEEAVMWDSAEWIEDPSLVYVIANAIRKGYEGTLDLKESQ